MTRKKNPFKEQKKIQPMPSQHVSPQDVVSLASPLPPPHHRTPRSCRARLSPRFTSSSSHPQSPSLPPTRTHHRPSATLNSPAPLRHLLSQEMDHYALAFPVLHARSARPPPRLHALASLAVQSHHQLHRPLTSTHAPSPPPRAFSWHDPLCRRFASSL